MQQRLRTRFPSEKDAPASQEPLALDPLERFTLVKRLVDALLNDETDAGLYERFKHEGRLPHDALGRAQFESLKNEAEGFAQRVKPHVNPGEEGFWDIEYPLEGLTLKGRVEGIHGKRLLIYRPSNLKGRHLLRAWISFLFLRAGAYPVGEAVIVFKDRAFRLVDQGQAKTHLSRLLGLYKEGHARPLPFFSETSMCLAESLAKGKSPKAAWLKAKQDTWEKSAWKNGGPKDWDDPYIQTCFAFDAPASEQAMGLAQSVYGPCLAACEEL